MTETELYSLWCSNVSGEPDLLKELESIKDDKEAINDRFYRDLEFGTGGLRGVIGAGTNRMNVFTVRRATQGFADYLNQEYKNPSGAISYDSRIKSDIFSKAAAEVLAANGIKVHIYTELMPTPCLSFAVRELKCQGGIMVTASHTTFTVDSPRTGQQKISTVSAANGTAATRINGIRLPFLLSQLSDIPAIHGSVTASTIRPHAVINPITVSPMKVALVTKVMTPLSVESGR